MKIWSKLFAGAVVGVAIQGGASFADTLDITLKLAYDPSHFSNNDGGEFKAYSISGGLPFANQAANVQLAANTFQTFCVEYSEEFNDSQTLYAQINTASRFGGAGGAMPDPAHPGMTFDPLDARTAFLYTKFSHGNLAGYNYTSGAGRSATAGQLQKAIWYLEQEIPSLDAGDTLALSWVSLANTAVAVGGEWDGMGIGNVRILNLWTDATHQDWDHRAQDQLVILDAPPQIATPLPGVATGGLALMGGLVLGRRRRGTAAR